MMKAIVVHRAGGYEQLRIETRPDLTPRADEVVVRTEAIGVNYADCVVRMGLYASAKEYVGWPIVPGFEFAGTVARVGLGVDDMFPGDPVFGVTRFGAYATEVCVPRDQLWLRPPQLDVLQAAAFPAVNLTAWFALFELAHPHRGDNVLVHSAAGGVGASLVQQARIAGCRVVGVVGAPHKVAAVEALGADLVIDKSREDLWARARAFAPDGYEVVLDANGVSTLRESERHLAAPGKLVIYGFHSMLPHNGRLDWIRLAWDFLRTPRFSPLDLTNRNRSVMAFNLSYLFERKQYLHRGMTEMLGWLANGSLRPATVTTHPFARVADAHRALESAQTVGKLVLVP